MFDKLSTYFESNTPITDEQFDIMKTLFTPKKVIKGEFILREGQMNKHSIFVAAGCLRTYTIDKTGKEHIVQFSPENWWTGDISFKKDVPSQCFIEALEDSEILLADIDSLPKLIVHIPALATFYQAALQKSAAAKNERIVSALSSSAEERYNDFVKKYPSLLQRVPQHMIASYLGISAETLSRIRKKQSPKR
jgi:CRP-like cAMP-binding protein